MRDRAQGEEQFKGEEIGKSSREKEVSSRFFLSFFYYTV